MSERLYYTDSYLREFEARVVEVFGDGRSVVAWIGLLFILHPAGSRSI